MKVVQWIGFILGLGFVTFLILFAVENHDKTRVVLPLLPGGVVLPHVTFFKVVYVSVFLGFVSGAFLCWVQGLGLRSQLAQCQRQHDALEEEVINLRNLPFEGDLER